MKRFLFSEKDKKRLWDKISLNLAKNQKTNSEQPRVRVVTSRGLCRHKGGQEARVQNVSAAGTTVVLAGSIRGCVGELRAAAGSAFIRLKAGSLRFCEQPGAGESPRAGVHGRRASCRAGLGARCMTLRLFCVWCALPLLL